MNRARMVLVLALLSFGLSACQFGGYRKEETGMIVYVGTYTGGGSQGIYSYELDLESGELEPQTVNAVKDNPSFVAIHPNGKFLYAVNEIGDYQGQKSGYVTAYEIQPPAYGLKPIGSPQPSGGGAPCHIVVERSGRNVLVANYSGGNVRVIPIAEDGSLAAPSDLEQHEGSSVSNRQKGPHAHSINVDAANRFAIAADLGTDKLYVYKLDAENGKLTPHDPPSTSVAPGGGPRHFSFHPNGKFAYSIMELNCTVVGMKYDAEAGTLEVQQTLSTLPPGESFKSGYSTAEVLVHPSGKFLYGSNRGHDTIAVYSIDEASGQLTYVENESTRGKTPRGFGIDPTGRWLIAGNQSSNTLAVFRIDQETGALEAVGETLSVPDPVCVQFLKVSK